MRCRVVFSISCFSVAVIKNVMAKAKYRRVYFGLGLPRVGVHSGRVGAGGGQGSCSRLLSAHTRSHKHKAERAATSAPSLQIPRPASSNTSSPKATHLKPAQTVPIGAEVHKFRSLWGTFSFPQSHISTDSYLLGSDQVRGAVPPTASNMYHLFVYKEHKGLESPLH